VAFGDVSKTLDSMDSSRVTSLFCWSHGKYQLNFHDASTQSGLILVLWHFTNALGAELKPQLGVVWAPVRQCLVSLHHQGVGVIHLGETS